MQIVVSIPVWYQRWHINGHNVWCPKESIATAIVNVPKCMTEAWTPMPLTYSIVHSTRIVRVPARRVSRPYACVIIRVNSGFTYVNVLYMRMHGWACRYCKLRSRTATRARVCMQDSSAGAYFRVIIRALARITALPINTDHGRACTQIRFSFFPLRYLYLFN